MTHRSKNGRTLRRKTWPRWFLLALVLGSFGLRLYSLAQQDIWWDEARNIDVSLRPFFRVAVAPELDIHPPVYFWLLHGWARLSGLSSATGAPDAISPAQIAFITRFLSLWAGVVGALLLYPLAKRCTPGSNAHVAGVMAAVIGALSPFWLAESQETRMYTVGLLWLLAAALALLDLLRGVDQSRPRRGAQIAFILFSALSFLTHYNALFILVAWYGWWALWALPRTDRVAQLRTLVVTGLLTTLLVAPVAPIALRQIPGYENPNLTVPTVGEYLAQNWQAHVAGYAFDGAARGAMSIANAWLWGVVALLVVGTAVSAVGVWQPSRGADGQDAGAAPVLASALRSPLAFLCVWLLGGLALYYIAVLDRGAFNPRYSSFVTPALYALLGMAVAEWHRLRRPLGWLGASVLVVGLALFARADLVDVRSAREDVSGLTEWLRQETGAGDVILVDQKYPFGFYYERYAIEPDETPVGAEDAPARYLFVDINTVDQRLADWAGAAQRVFWVRWFESDTDPRHAVTFLLDGAGERAGEKSFRGYTVDWWTLSPPNEFDLTSGLQPATHIFPPAVETVEIALPAAPLAPGDDLPVVIRWKRVTQGRTDRPLKARVALYEPGGSSIRAQNDRPLLNDRHLLPAEWSTEDRPLNVYTLPLPADLAPGTYEVRVLIYDADTLEPLTYVDLAGNPAGIEAVLGTVQVGE